MIGLRVNDWDRSAGEQSESGEALLTVGEPIIFEGVSRSFEHTRSVYEVEPMGLQVRSALRF